GVHVVLRERIHAINVNDPTSNGVSRRRRGLNVHRGINDSAVQGNTYVDGDRLHLQRQSLASKCAGRIPRSDQNRVRFLGGGDVCVDGADGAGVVYGDLVEVDNPSGDVVSWAGHGRRLDIDWRKDISSRQW